MSNSCAVRPHRLLTSTARTRRRETRWFPRRAEYLEPRRLLAGINGTVFNDANDNGSKDTGEAGLANWTVYDDQNLNGVLDSAEASATTDSQGNYSLSVNFCGGGSFYVRAVQQSAWRLTYPSYGYHTVSAPEDPESYVYGIDFGQTQRGMVQGAVFRDVYLNGFKDSGEAGVANRRVYLDANNNAVFDAGEKSALTASGGAYSLRNLDTNSSLRVRLVGVAGYTVTNAPEGLFEVTLTSPDPKTLNFGETRSLGAPVGLTATRVSSTQVNLAWSDLTGGETGFRVEQSVNGGAFTQIAQLPADTASYSVTVDPANDYVFRVAAYDANGNSNYSDTADPDALAAPTTLWADARTGGVTLTWDAVSGATGYSIYRRTTPWGPWGSPYASGITGTSYTDTNVVAGTSYYYAIASERRIGTRPPHRPPPRGPIYVEFSPCTQIVTGGVHLVAVTGAATGEDDFYDFNSAFASDTGSVPGFDSSLGTPYGSWASVFFSLEIRSNFSGRWGKTTWDAGWDLGVDSGSSTGSHSFTGPGSGTFYSGRWWASLGNRPQWPVHPPTTPPPDGPPTSGLSLSADATVTAEVCWENSRANIQLHLWAQVTVAYYYYNGTTCPAPAGTPGAPEPAGMAECLCGTHVADTSDDSTETSETAGDGPDAVAPALAAAKKKREALARASEGLFA
jgi:hypothetical protein